MTLTTRTITNAGQPLCGPDGALLAGVTITFLTVNERGIPVHAWDAVSHEYVVGKTSAITKLNAEFTVQLWCTDRSNTPVLHLCTVDLPGARPFSAPVPSGDGPLSWAQFMAGGLPLTPVQLNVLDTYRAGFAAALQAAQDAADRAEAAEVIPGPPTEMRTTATHVQWRVAGAPAWTDLYPLPDPPTTPNPLRPELRTTATHVQWRVEGDALWIDLFPLPESGPGPVFPPGQYGIFALQSGQDGGAVFSLQ